MALKIDQLALAANLIRAVLACFDDASAKTYLYRTPASNAGAFRRYLSRSGSGNPLSEPETSGVRC